MQLNPEQATRLNELVQQHHAQMKNMHQQRKQEQSQQRGDMHELRVQHREDLLSVLSYEQLYEFEITCTSSADSSARNARIRRTKTSRLGSFNPNWSRFGLTTSHFGRFLIVCTLVARLAPILW